MSAKKRHPQHPRPPSPPRDPRDPHETTPRARPPKVFDPTATQPRETGGRAALDAAADALPHDGDVTTASCDGWEDVDAA